MEGPPPVWSASHSDVSSSPSGSDRTAGASPPSNIDAHPDADARRGAGSKKRPRDDGADVDDEAAAVRADGYVVDLHERLRPVHEFFGGLLSYFRPKKAKRTQRLDRQIQQPANARPAATAVGRGDESRADRLALGGGPRNDAIIGEQGNANENEGPNAGTGTGTVAEHGEGETTGWKCDVCKIWWSNDYDECCRHEQQCQGIAAGQGEGEETMDEEAPGEEDLARELGSPLRDTQPGHDPSVEESSSVGKGDAPALQEAPTFLEESQTNAFVFDLPKGALEDATNAGAPREEEPSGEGEPMSEARERGNNFLGDTQPVAEDVAPESVPGEGLDENNSRDSAGEETKWTTLWSCDICNVYWTLDHEECVRHEGQCRGGAVEQSVGADAASVPGEDSQRERMLQDEASEEALREDESPGETVVEGAQQQGSLASAPEGGADLPQEAEDDASSGTEDARHEEQDEGRQLEDQRLEHSASSPREDVAGGHDNSMIENNSRIERLLVEEGQRAEARHEEEGEESTRAVANDSLDDSPQEDIAGGHGSSPESRNAASNSMDGSSLETGNATDDTSPESRIAANNPSPEPSDAMVSTAINTSPMDGATANDSMEGSSADGSSTPPATFPATYRFQYGGNPDEDEEDSTMEGSSSELQNDADSLTIEASTSPQSGYDVDSLNINASALLKSRNDMDSLTIDATPESNEAMDNSAIEASASLECRHDAVNIDATPDSKYAADGDGTRIDALPEFRNATGNPIDGSSPEPYDADSSMIEARASPDDAPREDFFTKTPKSASLSNASSSASSLENDAPTNASSPSASTNGSDSDGFGDTGLEDSDAEQNVVNDNDSVGRRGAGSDDDEEDDGSDASSAFDDEGNPLSDYERNRKRRMRRNEGRLRELGLLVEANDGPPPADDNESEDDGPRWTEGTRVLVYFPEGERPGRYQAIVQTTSYGDDDVEVLVDGEANVDLVEHWQVQEFIDEYGNVDGGTEESQDDDDDDSNASEGESSDDESLDEDSEDPSDESQMTGSEQETDVLEEEETSSPAGEERANERETKASAIEIDENEEKAPSGSAMPMEIEDREEKTPSGSASAMAMEIDEREEKETVNDADSSSRQKEEMSSPVVEERANERETKVSAMEIDERVEKETPPPAREAVIDERVEKSKNETSSFAMEIDECEERALSGSQNASSNSTDGSSPETRNNEDISMIQKSASPESQNNKMVPGEQQRDEQGNEGAGEDQHNVAEQAAREEEAAAEDDAAAEAEAAAEEEEAEEEYADIVAAGRAIAAAIGKPKSEVDVEHLSSNLDTLIEGTRRLIDSDITSVAAENVMMEAAFLLAAMTKSSNLGWQNRATECLLEIDSPLIEEASQTYPIIQVICDSIREVRKPIRLCTGTWGGRTTYSISILGCSSNLFPLTGGAPFGTTISVYRAGKKKGIHLYAPTKELANAAKAVLTHRNISGKNGSASFIDEEKTQAMPDTDDGARRQAQMIFDALNSDATLQATLSGVWDQNVLEMEGSDPPPFPADSNNMLFKRIGSSSFPVPPLVGLSSWCSSANVDGLLTQTRAGNWKVCGAAGTSGSTTRAEIQWWGDGDGDTRVKRTLRIWYPTGAMKDEFQAAIDALPRQQELFVCRDLHLAGSVVMQYILSTRPDLVQTMRNYTRTCNAVPRGDNDFCFNLGSNESCPNLIRLRDALIHDVDLGKAEARPIIESAVERLEQAGGKLLRRICVGDGRYIFVSVDEEDRVGLLWGWLRQAQIDERHKLEKNARYHEKRDAEHQRAADQRTANHRDAVQNGEVNGEFKTFQGWFRFGCNHEGVRDADELLKSTERLVAVLHATMLSPFDERWEKKKDDPHKGAPALICNGASDQTVRGRAGHKVRNKKDRKSWGSTNVVGCLDHISGHQKYPIRKGTKMYAHIILPCNKAYGACCQFKVKGRTGGLAIWPDCAQFVCIHDEVVVADIIVELEFQSNVFDDETKVTVVWMNGKEVKIDGKDEGFVFTKHAIDHPEAPLRSAK